MTLSGYFGGGRPFRNKKQVLALEEHVVVGRYYPGRPTRAYLGGRGLVSLIWKLFPYTCPFRPELIGRLSGGSAPATPP